MAEFETKISEVSTKAAADADPTTEVIPLPGFVVKTHNRVKVQDWLPGLKVFVNICHSPKIPAPPPATDDEIRRAVSAEDNTAYKVPLSLSSPRPGQDKSGKACLIFDACVHTNPLNKALRDPDYKLFLIELALEWIEEKHKLELSREFSMPKMLSKGQLATHFIRRPPRPIVSEVAVPAISSQPSAKTSRALPRPEYHILTEPSEGQPEFIVVRIPLPGVKSMKDTTLDIEAKRLIMTVPEKYHLDITFEHEIDINEGGAQFDKRTRVLMVTLQCRT
ncbi:PIH1 family [Gaertneriomyces semiglobifer]|nr:PIH1 family [Gaertneriomyces semiglobifer]